MTVVGILAATAIGFVLSAVLYSLPPVAALLARTSTPRAGLPMAVQLGSVVLRGLVVACLLAGLMSAAGWTGAATGAALGLALTTVPAVLLSGAVVHEGTAIPTAAVHLLDWTLKLVVSGAVIGALA